MQWQKCLRNIKEIFQMGILIHILKLNKIFSFLLTVQTLSDIPCQIQIFLNCIPSVQLIFGITISFSDEAKISQKFYEFKMFSGIFSFLLILRPLKFNFWQKVSEIFTAFPESTKHFLTYAMNSNSVNLSWFRVRLSTG